MSLTGDVLNLEMPFLVKASRLGWRMECVAEYTSMDLKLPRCGITSLLHSDQAALARRSVDIVL
jgi:hypothetical protein